jgi:hypothetical protein
MLVKMRGTAASPKYILDAGGVYNLPREQAMEFIEKGYADPAPAGSKATPIPPRPDIGETEGAILEDEE